VVKGQALCRGLGFDMGALDLKRAGFGQGWGFKAKLVGDALGQGAKLHRCRKPMISVRIGLFDGPARQG
jgi:hypothetical protein